MSKIKRIGMFLRDKRGGSTPQIVDSFLVRPVGFLGFGVKKYISREVVRASDIDPVDWGYGLWLYKHGIYQVEGGNNNENIKSLVIDFSKAEKERSAANLRPERVALEVVGFFNEDGVIHVSDSSRVYFPNTAFRRDGKLNVSPIIEAELVIVSEEKPIEWEHDLLLFQGLIYVHIRGNYTEGQIKYLITQRYDSDRKLLGNTGRKYHSNETVPDLDTIAEENMKRVAIPKDVRLEVWRRDGGKCVVCGSRDRLEYDHIIPVSKGGSNTARNIELLCEKHNRSKGANIQ